MNHTKKLPSRYTCCIYIPKSRAHIYDISKIDHVNYRLLHISATILTEVAEARECTPCWNTIKTRIKNIKLFELIWEGKITVINQAYQISQDKLGNGVFSTWLVILTMEHCALAASSENLHVGLNKFRSIYDNNFQRGTNLTWE